MYSTGRITTAKRVFSSMLKIGYFGDGPWASLALTHIAACEADFSIAFITPRFDTQDPELKGWADRLGVPFLPHENVNAEYFRNKIKAFGCDILVSMSFNQILRSDIIALPPKGFINCHAGALPFYRGRNPLNWALINGEKEFGVTVHYVDEGIDTGDIITQNMVPISIDDTYADLLEKAHKACAETLLSALKQIAGGTVKVKKQNDIHPVGFYCGRRRPGDEKIDWNQGSASLHNFIRAITLPGPGARCTIEGEDMAVLESRLIEDAPAYKNSIGEIVGRDADGVIVKTADTTLRIVKVAKINKEGMPEDPYVPRWPIGKRFCS